MSYHVLIPVDKNEQRAVQQARYVNRLSEAGGHIEVTVLHVVRNREADTEFSAIEAGVAAADHLEEAGIDVERTVEPGPVSEVIVNLADEYETNEIVIGGRKRAGVTQVLLGSTATDLMLSAEQPVTITGERVALGTGNRSILVPVDRNRTRAKDQAAYVTNLPVTPGETTVTVLYVFRHLDYKGAPDHEFEEIDAAVETADTLENAGYNVERLAIGGEISRKILEVANEREVDGLVVGGRKRSGLQRVIFGSTSQDVILSATRPVTLTG